jgi:uncharacterized protein YbjT (DUF2867 family)
LGIEQAKNSKYAISKLNGEISILNNFNNSTILRPSIIFSRDDKFTTKFMSFLNILPIFPMYYKGLTKFQPIYCGDLCNAIVKLVEENNKTNIIECGGPEILNFKEIIKILLKQIGKKRLLVNVPYSLATIQSKIFELFPRPLLTFDQLKLLKFDNIVSGNYSSLKDLNLEYVSTFEEELELYSYAWKKEGQFNKF